MWRKLVDYYVTCTKQELIEKLVLKNAKKHFSDSFVKELDNKIEPYHLPVTDDHVLKKLNKTYKNFYQYSHFFLKRNLLLL